MQPERAEILAQVDRRLEQTNLVIKDHVDLAKHISTLAAGSIVLMGTFIDKFKPPVIFKATLFVSVGTLLLGIINAVLCTYLYTAARNHLYLWVFSLERNSAEPDKEAEIQYVRNAKYADIAAGIAVGGFVVGLAMIGWFVVSNIIIH